MTKNPELEIRNRGAERWLETLRGPVNSPAPGRENAGRCLMGGRHPGHVTESYCSVTETQNSPISEKAKIFVQMFHRRVQEEAAGTERFNVAGPWETRAEGAAHAPAAESEAREGRRTRGGDGAAPGRSGPRWPEQGRAPALRKRPGSSSSSYTYTDHKSHRRH